MRTRWVIVTLSALAIGVAATLLPRLRRPAPVEPPAKVSCRADAKTANLDFALKDVNGRIVKLADYKGKVLLLDFWATWCPPCKVEIPGFVELYEKYRARGFEIAGVVVQDPFERAKPFAERYRMNYAILDGNDRDDLEASFGPIPALPTSFLIDRAGKICTRHIGLPQSNNSDSLERAVRDAFEAEIKGLL